MALKSTSSRSDSIITSGANGSSYGSSTPTLTPRARSSRAISVARVVFPAPDNPVSHMVNPLPLLTNRLLVLLSFCANQMFCLDCSQCLDQYPGHLRPGKFNRRNLSDT